jgi:hypothetical protein
MVISPIFHNTGEITISAWIESHNTGEITISVWIESHNTVEITISAWIESHNTTSIMTLNPCTDGYFTSI